MTYLKSLIIFLFIITSTSLAYQNCSQTGFKQTPETEQGSDQQNPYLVTPDNTVNGLPNTTPTNNESIALNNTESQSDYQPQSTTKDPGFSYDQTGKPTGISWYGAWQPPTLPNGDPNDGKIVIVDQTGPQGGTSNTYLPGCINQHSNSYNTCRYETSYYDNQRRISVGLGVGYIVSVRYFSLPEGDYYNSVYSLSLLNVIGGDLNFNASLSISTIPGDFSSSLCSSNPNQVNPSITVGKGERATYPCRDSNCTPIITYHCQITPNTAYYVNVRVDSACSDAPLGCTASVEEPSALLK